jgi:hypothetical protein
MLETENHRVCILFSDVPIMWNTLLNMSCLHLFVNSGSLESNCCDMVATMLCYVASHFLSLFFMLAVLLSQ